MSQLEIRTIRCLRQPGGLGVLRGVVRGFSEEARARGFPSPSLDGFGFVVIDSDLSIVAGCQIGSRSLVVLFRFDLTSQMI